MPPVAPRRKFGSTTWRSLSCWAVLLLLSFLKLSVEMIFAKMFFIFLFALQCLLRRAPLLSRPATHARSHFKLSRATCVHPSHSLSGGEA